jgi:hypothetical protein
MEEQFLLDGTATPAVLEWPGDIEPAVPGQQAFPFQPELPVRVVSNAADTLVLSEVADQVIGEPASEFVDEARIARVMCPDGVRIEIRHA